MYTPDKLEIVEKYFINEVSVGDNVENYENIGDDC
jgi:hypothetical protein